MLSIFDCHYAGCPCYYMVASVNASLSYLQSKHLFCSLSQKVTTVSIKISSQSSFEIRTKVMSATSSNPMVSAIFTFTAVSYSRNKISQHVFENIGRHLLSISQGSLTEREGSVQLTSLFKKVQISSFYFEYITYLFHRTGYLNEEVNSTEPSPV